MSPSTDDYLQGSMTPDLEPLPEFTERTERQILEDIVAQTFDMLTELKHIRAALGQSGTSRSSVELAQNAKGGIQITVKAYEGSDVEQPIVDAIAGFRTAYREVQHQQLADWQETVNHLNGASK